MRVLLASTNVYRSVRRFPGPSNFVRRVGAEFSKFVRDSTRVGVSSDRTGQRAI